MDRLLRCTVCVALVAAVCHPVRAERLDCLVTPALVSDLAFGVNGVIERVLVDRGDKVRKGDVIAQLDATLEQANLAIAKGRLAERAVGDTAKFQLEIAKLKLARGRELEQKKIVAQSKFEDVTLEHETARLRVREQEEIARLKQLEVARVEAALALRTIRSPFDGYVVERHVTAGEYVENKRALTVAQVDPVYADVIVPAAMFALVKMGQAVRVDLHQPEDRRVEGKVARIDPYVDAASSTFRVKVALANPEFSILPGFRCHADIGAVGMR